jgi:hypothetical protein
VTAETWAKFVSSLQQMLCLVPMHFNTTFSSSSPWGAHSVENSWFHLNPLIGIFYSLCRNAFNSLIGVEYTKDFRCPHGQKSGGLRSGDRAGQLTRVSVSYPLLTESLVQVRRKWGGTPPCINRMCCHWWRCTCSNNIGKSSENDDTLHLLVC